MNFINWEGTNPISGLSHIQNEMSNLFDFLSSSPLTREYAGEEFPQVAISTNNDNVIVRAELPGIKVNELDLQVVDDILTIRGERKTIINTDKAAYLRQERNYGTFGRSIMLPEKVDVDNVSASYKNGVLTVILPKAAETKPKQIAIQKS